jgi:hypothetical protein
MEMFFGPDLFGEVQAVIKSWKPRGCRTEKDYERSLEGRLRSELKDRKVQPQYGSARQRVDIVVGNKVPIEIKKDLVTTAKLQQTLGQLDQYIESWEKVFLVLCGNTPPDILASLRQYARKKASFFGGEKIQIFTV